MADAALATQAQMRKNAEDLQTYMKDLMNWEQEVGQKDESLRAAHSISKSLPPVRNSVSSKLTTSKQESQSKRKGKEKEKEQPIRGGDFRAWDKYDVDAALEKVDADNEGNETDEETEEHRARKLQEHIGNQEKEKGNVQFKAGKYLAAAECYTRGMEHDPFNAILPANRAMAYLKVKKYAEAEADCSTAIQLDGKYVKAWQRRAAARVNLNRLEEALSDYKKVLKLDPENKTAKLEVQSLPKRIVETKEAARKAFRPLEHIGDSTKLSSEKSNRPLYRIPIDEIGSDTEGNFDDSTSSKGNIGITEVVSDSDGGSFQTDVQFDSKSANAGRNKHEATKSEIGIMHNHATTTSKVSVTSSTNDAHESSETEKRDATESSTTRKTSVPRSRTTCASPKKKTGALKSKIDGNAPLTSAKFETSWRQFKNNRKKLIELFQMVKPPELPGLIKSNLCPEFLCMFFCILRQEFSSTPEKILEYMLHLTRAQRFDQTLMFLDDEELRDGKEIFAMLQKSDLAQDRVLKLAEIYGIKVVS